MFRKRKKNGHLMKGFSDNQNCFGYHRKCGHCIFLNDTTPEQNYIVKNNPDKKSFEMGIYKGCSLKVIQNNPTEESMIIGIGETRLIIPRELARFIKVS